MKKNIYVKVLVFLMFCFIGINNLESLSYRGCSYTDVSRLKSYVSNVNISYDYYIENNRAYYNVTISNIIPGVYFIDSETQIKYNYYNTVDGELTLYGYKNITGSYSFYSELNECYGVKLGTKYYKFPVYNYYYDDPLCAQNSSYSLCQKWADINYSYTEFKDLINEYNENKNKIEEQDKIEESYEKTFFDNIVNFYVNYYYIILCGIIVICIVVMIISSRKNKFDI